MYPDLVGVGASFRLANSRGGSLVYWTGGAVRTARWPSTNSCKKILDTALSIPSLKSTRKITVTLSLAGQIYRISEVRNWNDVSGPGLAPLTKSSKAFTNGPPRRWRLMSATLFKKAVLLAYLSASNSRHTLKPASGDFSRPGKTFANNSVDPCLWYVGGEVGNNKKDES